jgi:hypothetical protein
MQMRDMVDFNAIWVNSCGNSHAIKCTCFCIDADCMIDKLRIQCAQIIRKEKAKVRKYKIMSFLKGSFCV